MAGTTVDPVYVPANITTLAGTTPAAPLVSDIALPHGVLETIELLIPPGHLGATGIRFLLSGQQVLPWSNATVWIVGDDLDQLFDMNTTTAEHFQAVTYNVGNFAHTHYVRCRVRQLEQGGGIPTITPLALGGHGP